MTPEVDLAEIEGREDDVEDLAWVRLEPKLAILRGSGGELRFGSLEMIS